MPISGPSSYLPTTDQFIAHWTAANAALLAPVTLRGGVAVADLTALREQLATERTALTQQLNEREFARGDIYTQARALVNRLEQFNGRIRVLYAEGTRFVNALPKAPDYRASQERVITPLDDVAGIWEQVDNSGDPVILSGNYGYDVFLDDLTALKTSYQAYQTALINERMARGVRNETQEQIYPILKQYREAIPTFFPEGSSIIETLPRLTPLPGSTPDPVNASAVWDEAEAKARITWEASDNSNLQEYEVRYTPGEEYDEDDETVVATILPSDPRELLTDAGLTQPGAFSTFKVYVLLTTGNERGSATMVVERPAEGGGG